MLYCGELLRARREEKRISQVELSKLIGISRQSIIKWESNKAQPSIGFCVKLADLYGISLDELVGRDFIPTIKEK